MPGPYGPDGPRGSRLTANGRRRQIRVSRRRVRLAAPVVGVCEAADLLRVRPQPVESLHPERPQRRAAATDAAVRRSPARAADATGPGAARDAVAASARTSPLTTARCRIVLERFGAFRVVLRGV